MLKRWSALLLLLFLAVGSTTRAEPPRNVVVITIDGFPSYLLGDPKGSYPEIRALIAKGVVSRAGMTVSNPAVTWPNHTTLMTGVKPERHGVIYNGMPRRRGPGQPVQLQAASDQEELVQGPLLFDVMKKAGLESAAINWPCTRGSTSIRDNFPDVPDMLQYTTPQLKQELASKGLVERFEVGQGVVHDEVWVEAACQVIRERMPRLLALHLLNLDSTHHRYGPRSQPGYTASSLTDALVGRVLRALDEAGVREQTAVFVVADHGFTAVSKTLRPNAILRKEGLIEVDGDRIKSARVHVVPEGGIGMIYLNNPETADQDRETVKRLFQNAEGVASVFGPEEYDRYHFPSLERQPGMADLVIAAKPGYAVAGQLDGDAFVVPNPNGNITGAHGYLSTEPEMNALFVAAGAGIATGKSLDSVDNTDLAPTVAKLLGISLPDATGRALDEILTVSE
jgi:predicted AlkP superfamily pyrophosphatase or phosphodiesterase